MTVNHEGTKVTKIDEETEQVCRSVIGAAIEVHRELGPGFLESVYEDALCVELQIRNLQFVRQQVVALQYKGHAVGQSRLDLVVERRLIVELKAVESLADVHTAQLLSYLRATQLRLGLLLNFNVPVLRAGIKRVAL